MPFRPLDRSFLAGLLLLVLVILTFVAVTRCQPGFFQHFSTVF